MGVGIVAIGSGPSLRAVDVRAVRTLPTMAYNRSHVAWEQWGFTPTYYACFDPVVAHDNAAAWQRLIVQAPQTRFFLHAVARDLGIPAAPNVTFVTPSPGAVFSQDLTRPTDFGNVGASSMQTIAALGFTRVLLLGMDAFHSSWKAEEARPDGDGYVWGTRNPNYFDDAYVQGARQVFEPDNVHLFGRWPTVIDQGQRLGMTWRLASPGSQLTCVQAVSFTEGLAWVAE